MIKKITLIVKKTKTELDDLIVNAVKSPLGYLILLQGFYFAIISLQLPEKIGGFNITVTDIVHAAYILAIYFIMLYFVFKIIDIIAFYLHKQVEKSKSTLDDQLVPLVVRSLRILVAVLGILFILQNDPFDYDVTSLLAGLGLGGLAFALAAQDTVGTVEDVGFRSTRIRRFDQALVTVPKTVREEFNLKIMQMLEEMGVEIAFPSQTVYLNKITERSE